MTGRPSRFTIRPDDYHVPYAGTTNDGHQFFLSSELFDLDGHAFVGLFLWTSNGTFLDLKVNELSRANDVPPGQAGAAQDAESVVQAQLKKISPYRLQPITVEPFLRTVKGVEFGWKFGQYDDGTGYLNIEPGDFICYYAPWDGREYDT